MATNNNSNFIGDEPQDDPSLIEYRETHEDIDVLPRQYPARQTQLLPQAPYMLRQNSTGEHPPIRSTSTDKDKILALPDCEECPSQDAVGESHAPYYGQDDEENVGSGV